MNKIVTVLNRHIEVRQSVADMIFGAVVIVLNLFLLFIGTSKYITSLSNTYGISSRTFPRVVFIAAIFLGVFLVLEGYSESKRKDSNEKMVTFHLISFAILADIIFFVFTIQPLGYPISNFIMLVIMYWLSGGKSWLKCLIMSVAFTVCSVLFFYTYLKLSIPMGLLSGIIK